MSLTNSIDTYLENFSSRPMFAAIGKLAIAKIILGAEQNSSLHLSKRTASLKYREPPPELNWANRAFKLLQAGCYVDEVERFFENATFVVFNYDRVLEVYFSEALEICYNISQAEADAIVGAADIIHPYGCLGSIRQQYPNLAHVGFGDVSDDLVSISQGIRVYSESQEDNDLVPRVKAAMRTAETVCFLGFSYQRQNMDLLHPDPHVGYSTSRTIVGSAYSMSEFNINRVGKELMGMFNVDQVFVGGPQETCAQFLDSHSKAFE